VISSNLKASTGNPTWSNKYQDRKVTPAIPDKRIDLGGAVCIDCSTPFGPIFRSSVPNYTCPSCLKNYGANPPSNDSDSRPQNVICSTRAPTPFEVANYQDTHPESLQGLEPLVSSSFSRAALDTKAGLLTQGLRQEPVRVHSTSTSPKNPTTVNIFGPKYH
jgi:hypothetical protein